jgi:hypothetical protein
MSRSTEESRGMWSVTKAPVWVAAAIVVVAAAIGFWAGSTSAFGSKHLTVKTGQATLHNSDNWLTSFDTDDPQGQLSFSANAVASNSAAGFQDHGVPPCLEVGKKVPVRVGYTSIDFPSGISAPVVQWVECLG